MDLDAAVAVHKAWTPALAAYIGDPDGSFTDSADDTLCEIGRWLHGDEARDFRRDPDFIELKIAHAKFHLEAAKVLRKVNRGEDPSEDALIGSHSPYAIASDEVARQILRMKEKLQIGDRRRDLDVVLVG